MTQQIRLSPSGPVVGTLSLTPLRVAEDDGSLESPLVLDGGLEDINEDLRAELSAPFDSSHYFSAECDIDVGNASTNTEAQVQVYLQVSYDDGANWDTVHSETHVVGANGAAAIRQIQPIRFHAPPTALSAWGTMPAGATSMQLRAAALLFDGDANDVQVESTTQWIRLTEHGAP